MFDEKFKAEYKAISAPEELYERILNAEKGTPRRNNIAVFRKIAASAAAVAVVAVTGFVLFSGNTAPEVFVGSEKLTGEIALTQVHSDGIMLARADNTVECELSLGLKKASVISLSDGLLFSENGEKLLEAGEDAEFSEEVSLKWTVPGADTEKEYTLTLKDRKNTYLVKLYFDSTDGNWAVSLTE